MGGFLRAWRVLQMELALLGKRGAHDLTVKGLDRVQRKVLVESPASAACEQPLREK